MTVKPTEWPPAGPGEGALLILRLVWRDLRTVSGLDQRLVRHRLQLGNKLTLTTNSSFWRCLTGQLSAVVWRQLHLTRIAAVNQFHGASGIVGESLKLHRQIHEV